MLTPEQAFKAAFLEKCAEIGLSLEETNELIKVALQNKEGGAGLDALLAPWKTFWDVGGSLAKTTVKTVGDLVKPVGTVALGTAILGPPALGYAGGYAAGKATDLDDEDAKELRKRQLINEYRRLAENAKNRKRVPV